MNYAAFAPAYAPQYAPPYAPQYAMAAYTGANGSMTPAGAATTPPVPAPATDKPGITTKAWWQETTFNIPRWALGLGAVSLATIGYGWNAGWFDANGTRRTVKRTSSVRRDPGRRKARSHGRKTSHKRRGRRDHLAPRYDFDF